MAKKSQPKLRLDSSTLAEYNQLMRNAKNKVARTRKKYGIDLSGEIELPSIKSFKSRKQFNEWKDDVKSFTSRYNTNYQFRKNARGVVATVREINEVKRDTKKAQKVARDLQNKIKDKPFISGGKTQGTVKDRSVLLSRPNAAGVVIPPDFKFDNMSDRKQFEKKAENMKERAAENFFDKRMTTMRDNYADLLSLSFHDSAESLADRIRNLPPDIFFEMYNIFDEFDFSDWDSEGNYTGEDAGEMNAAQGKLNQISSYIDRYERGKVNFDLKHDHFS